MRSERRWVLVPRLVLLGLAAIPLYPSADGFGAADDAKVCDRSLDNVDKRIPACTRLLEERPEGINVAGYYLNRGNAYFSLGDYAAAVRDFDEAINRNPTFVGAYKNRGLAKQLSGDVDEAIADFNRAIKLDGNSAELYNSRGAALNDKEEFELAIADFDTALKLDPKYVKSYHNRAFAFHHRRLLDRALADYSAEIKLSPGDSRGYVGRASVLLDKGNLAGAISDLDAGLRLDPKNAEILSDRGEAKRLKGDREQALADYNEAIRLAPEFAKAYNNRALVYRDKGLFDQAIVDLGEAILHSPKFDVAFANRGEIWRLKGDLAQSLQDLDKAVSLNPKSPVALSLRGETLRTMGEFDRALADFTEALHVTPDFVAAFTGRGLVEEVQANVPAAKVDFQKALALPSDIDAEKAKPAQAIAKAHLDNILKAEALKAEALKAAALKADALKAEALKAEALKEEALKAETLKAEALKAEALKAAVPHLPDPGRRIALVIGNSSYQVVSELPNPRPDAATVAASLKEDGFETRLIPDATRQVMVDALRDFRDQADSADWAVVYYAGHGIEIGGTNYLVPIDAHLRSDVDADDEAIPLNRVLDSVSGAKKLKLVVLDACRDNPFLRTMKRSIALRSVNRGLASIRPEGGVLVVYAAEDGQVAEDGDGKHSPFSEAFVRRLAEPGVEINKLFRLVTADVMTATGNRQRPYQYGSLPGAEDLYFKVH